MLEFAPSPSAGRGEPLFLKVRSHCSCTEGFSASKEDAEMIAEPTEMNPAQHSQLTVLWPAELVWHLQTCYSGWLFAGLFQVSR